MLGIVLYLDFVTSAAFPVLVREGFGLD